MSAKGKVPIIDDEPGRRDLLSQTLSGIGGHVRVYQEIPIGGEIVT